ncbi:hypothetical protein [Viridibacillus arvi]|uniref:hypothetical protein n=1 Tax=Viridibacillus arvi TaxID=263475 RepID=UPI0034CE747F
MVGVCIDSALSVNLKKGEQYYLFTYGREHFYASRFKNKGAHFGVYEKKFFEIIQGQEEGQDNWAQEPPKSMIELNQAKIYKAELVWRQRAYAEKQLGTYYIKPKNTHCFFYLDPQLNKSCGRFPLHWFANFEEHDPNAEPIIQEMLKSEWEQLSLF